MMKSMSNLYGEVLSIKGETYVIREAAGNQVRIRIDQHSKIEDPPKVGDKVEAKFTITKGLRAESITKQ